MYVDRAVGIDLGTTNSEIAMLHPSEKEIVLFKDRFNRKTVPSAVAWDPVAEKLLVGHPARARRGKEPAPIESIKRKMGQKTKVLVGPREMLPEEVSGAILAELRDRMAEYLSHGAARVVDGAELRVARAVVTVPAYFDAPQVEATRKAGEIAGLDTLGILHEPTAAAIYHTWKNRLGDGNFLVYDLGGGTFDVSILRCVGGEYQVLAIDGDNYLGGDDFDRMYAEWLRKELTKQGYKLDLDVRGNPDDRARFGRIVHLAQEIKESLSTSPVVSVSKHGVLDDKAGESVSFEAEVGLADYEKIIADLVDTTIGCCERALARSQEVAHVGIDAIDHVVLVGGSTRVPLVMRRVTDALCKRSKSDKPLQDEVDTCVALGAAIHAAQLGGLTLGDPAKKTTVTFTSPLVSHKAEIKLAVRVDAAPEGAAEIAVLQGGAEVVRAPIENGAVRATVPLGDAEETACELEIAGPTGDPVRLPFPLYRGDVRPRASTLSRPSVVAKDISIEILRAGRRERKTLLARGTGLPAEATHRFFTADQSGVVVLRLLQNRLPIKTLVVQIPKDTPTGAPVDLTVTCDEVMRVKARAVVAGAEIWAQVEAPEQLPFDPKGSVDGLLAEAEGAGRALWGTFGSVYRREAEQLVVSIREVAAVDPDKLQALCERLRLLIEEYRGAGEGELVPGRQRFDDTLNSLRLIVYRSATPVMGLDKEAWEAKIASLEERGYTAYDARDASLWRRTYNELQALLETAHQEEFASMRVDDPAYLSRRLASTRSWARRLEQDVTEFVPATADEVRELQATEQRRLLEWLRDKAHRPLEPLEVGAEADAAALRRTLDQVNAELERIELALERIPSLGLVTDRGATGA